MIYQYVKQFCREAKKHGITRLNFYLEESLSRELSVYNGELETLVRSEQNQLFIEGLVGESSGSVFVENLDPSLVEEHIRAIIESAEACPGKFLPYELDGIESAPQTESSFADLKNTVQAMCQAEQTAYAGLRWQMKMKCLPPMPSSLVLPVFIWRQSRETWYSPAEQESLFTAETCRICTSSHRRLPRTR